jgi:hypothetical protein
MEQGFFGNISFKELVQYIEGSVDEFRKHEIGQWINSDPRRKDFYIKLSEAWLNPGEIKDLRKEQLENDWNIITSRISNTSEIKPDKNTGIAKSHPGRDWLRVAAAVLFILSVAGAYFAGKGRKSAAEGTGLSYYEIFVPKGQRSQLPFQTEVQFGSMLKANCVSQTALVATPGKCGLTAKLSLILKKTA